MSRQSSAIDVETRLQIEDLIYEHAWLLDHHQSQHLGELYTVDGVMTGVGPDRAGRAAIADWGAKRATMRERVSRHIYTNIQMKLLDDDRIEVRSIAILLRHDGDCSQVNVVDALLAMADTVDLLVQEPDGKWRFQERKSIVIFESAAHKH